MKDDSEKHLDELFAAARAHKPDTSRLEYGFETRLLARLREEEGNAAPWHAFAWKLSPFFAGIVVALGIWTYCSPQDPELQTAVKSASDESQMVEYLIGNQI